MDGEDSRIALNPLEIEMLLVALDLYERRIKRKRSDDPIFQAVRVLRRRLTIAAQRARQGSEPDVSAT
jgi:hypothetical protein